MTEHDPSLYARSFADIYDDWYTDLDDPQHLVRAFGQRCSPGDTIIELGGGTGRLALPLAHSGFNVISLDISAPMLAATAGPVHSLVSDMACVAIRDQSAHAVFVAYNTILNLASTDLQQACLAEVARTLRPGGSFAVEAFVAPERDAITPAFDISIKSHPTRPDASLAILTGPDSDAGSGQIIGSHVELAPDSTTCRPWTLAYQSPSDFDDAAAAVGLESIDRWADWAGTPFGATSSRHVSWYQRTNH